MPTNTTKRRRFPKSVKCTECDSRCPIVDSTPDVAEYMCPSCFNSFERKA